MNKTVMILGLVRKAGKLSLGTDCVKQSLMKGQSKLIIATNDVSNRSLQKIKRVAEEYNVGVLTINSSMDDMEVMFGKKVGVIAINDEGFAKKITNLED